MKLSILLILLSLTSLVLGQNNKIEPQNAKIDEAEKKRLENEFKALGTFYIDDSGLVVYQRSANDEDISVKKNVSQENLDSKVALESTTTTVVSEEPQTIIENNREILPEKTQSYTSPSQNVAVSSSAYIKKEVNSIANGKTTPPREVEVKVVENLTTVTQKEQLPEPIATKSQITKVDSTPSKERVLNRKRKSQYKTMEEAALAVESLLDELKKEQVKTGASGGSMSSKLSKGVTKDLRKKSDGAITGIRDVKSINEREAQIQNLNLQFGDEPSYFINGVQVDKVEINKLRKGDIIDREIRVRNTITGNPNGEIWYDVREDKR